MIITVPNRTLWRQHYKTSCWISAAHYVLQYLGVNVAITQLEAQYYRPDINSAMAMSGAGHPKTIINSYSFDTGRVAKTVSVQDTPKDQIIALIAGNIREGIPVVASIRSQQVKGFGHALLITGINVNSGHIIFKDPGTVNSSNPFAIEVRSQTYDSFKDGFSYRYAQSMGMNVFAYCSQITYISDFSEMSLFD